MKSKYNIGKQKCYGFDFGFMKLELIKLRNKIDFCFQIGKNFDINFRTKNWR